MIFESEYPDFLVPDISLGLYLVNAMRKYGNLPALIDADTGDQTTYQQLREEVETLSELLKGVGVKKGCVVALVAKVNPSTVPLIIAILNCGATICGCRTTNKWTVYQELNATNATMLIVEDSSFKEIDTHLREKAPNTKISVCVSEIKHLKPNLLSYVDERPVEINDEIDPRRDATFIFRSSGTTGEPKGIVCSHRFFVAVGEAYNKFLNCSCNDVNALVCNYISGFFIDCLSAFLSSGSTTVLLPYNSAKQTFDCITKYKVSCLMCTRILALKDVVAEPILPDHDFRSLKLVLTTGTNFPPALLKQVNNKMGSHVTVGSGLGSTECGWISISTTDEAPFNSAGKLLPGVKIKLLDSHTNRELGLNEAGSLYVKSHSMLSTYLNKTVEECFEDGWFNTGDVARYDEAGYLYVLGRQKEYIYQNGLQIFPNEIDGILQEHKKIKDAAVTAITLPNNTEAAKVFVVKSEESLTGQEVINYLDEKLGESFQLTGGVQFIEAIPRVGLGKVQRNRLKEMNINA